MGGTSYKKFPPIECEQMGKPEIHRPYDPSVTGYTQCPAAAAQPVPSRLER